MRRVLAYLDFKAVHWTTLGADHGRTVTPELEEGLRAYAGTQAQLLRDMASGFEAKWAVLRGEPLPVEELKRLLHPQEHRRKKANFDEEEQDHDELGGEGAASEDEGVEDVEDASEVLFD